MTEMEIKRQQAAEQDRRRRLNRKSSAATVAGIILFSEIIPPSQSHLSGLPYWLVVILSLILIGYGLLISLPRLREEKRERDEWHRQYKAEIDAANEFVFGTAKRKT